LLTQQLCRGPAGAKRRQGRGWSALLDDNPHLNTRPLGAVTLFAEKLNIAFCVTSALDNRDDVVELKLLRTSTLYALALVSLPDE